MAITRAQQVRQMLREGSEPMEQAGVMNYMPSEMITVPRIAKSSPNTPTAKLAYITPEEQDILVKLNLYGSLEGKPNRGPGGIPSLEGDFGPGGQDFGSYEGGADYGGARDSSGKAGDFSGFVDTGTGDYVKIDRNIPVSDQTVTPFVNRVTDRIKGFGTGAKNYLSDPSNRRGMLANIALTSLFGPLGLLMSGLARSSRFQNMLTGLKGDDLLQDTSTIEFDKPELDKSVIDLGFRGKKNIINEPVVYGTDINNLVADASKDKNRELLENILNPDLNIDDALDREEFKRQREKELLKEIGIVL